MTDEFNSIDAFYDFLEPLIADAAEESPLYEAQSFRSLRASVDQATKIVRVDYFSGRFVLSNDDARNEQDIKLIVECFVTPTSDQETDQIAAKLLSTRMAKAIFIAYTKNTDWGGKATDIDGDEWDADYANFGGVNRGATYLYPTLNPY